ncbi:hypothetical protein ABMA28_009741 [Loxostege sticticalis]|uniref:Odorant receptor n=1 Tax=Loxostege sticticalis TaxID=481309 RepID=A0ABD0SBA2_LOXSC
MTTTKADTKNRVYSHTDYDDSYKIITKNILSLVGIRIAQKDSSFARLCWNILYWAEFANLFIALVLDGYTACDVIRSSALKEENIVFMMLPCMGYLVIALLKSYKTVYQRGIYENLVSELRSMWPQGSVTEEEHIIIDKALKELNIVVKGYYWCNLGLCFSVIGPPYVDLVRRAFGEHVPRTLPYFYWVPYDEFQPVAYELTLALHAWQTMLTLWFMQAGDLLFCAFLSHITTQFDLLCLRIQRLFHVPVDQQLIAEYPLGKQSKKPSDNETFSPLNESETRSKQEKELKKIIVRHNDLIRLSNDVENLFSFALLINFFNSSIVICFCGFCCVMVEKWNVFMYKTFLATSLSQTWLLCWHGQKLLESSARVADALYNSGWYIASNPIRKSILIMIHRSQKNVCVTTYGFSVISLSSYTTIIKTAWSYFTLLLNTYNQ